jgi:hypothetical protein
MIFFTRKKLLVNNGYIVDQQNKKIIENSLSDYLNKDNPTKELLKDLSSKGYSYKNFPLEELEKTKTYILTKRTPSEKILITVNKNTVDDLLYTLYKSIIYCINDAIPAFKSNMIDIFVLLSFLKLLRNRDEITLNYLSANF